MKPKLLPFKRPGQAELIQCLIEKIEQAERGEIASFTFACEHVDGSIEHDSFIDDNSSAYKLVGIVETLKTRILKILENV